MKYLIMLTIFFIMGCVTKYQEPVSGSVAKIELNHAMGRGYTYLDKTSSFECDFPKDESMGRVGAMIDSFKQRSVKVEAGKNINLAVQTSIGYDVSNYLIQKQYCLMYVNFTPELNHTYSIHQINPINSKCEVFVVDKETRVAPKDLKTANRTNCYSK